MSPNFSLISNVTFEMSEKFGLITYVISARAGKCVYRKSANERGFPLWRLYRAVGLF